MTLIPGLAAFLKGPIHILIENSIFHCRLIIMSIFNFLYRLKLSVVAFLRDAVAQNRDYGEILMIILMIT